MAARRPLKRAHTADTEATEPMGRPLRRYRLPPLGFPTKTQVRLRYAATINLNPTASGDPVFYAMCANGMYDPDYTGVGHQPMGFDQWMSAYNHFQVDSSSISVRWIPTSADSVAPGIFGVILDDDQVPPYIGGDYYTLLETGRTGHASYGLVEGIGKGKNPMVRKTFNAKRFFGSKFIEGDLKYAGNTGTNPTETAFFHIWACTSGLGADPPGQLFEVVIDFVATLYEPKALPSS